MDYPEDKELAHLLAQSDELSRRSKTASETCALQSAALRELLSRSAAVCAESDRLCGRPAREPGAGVASRRARRGPV